MSVSFPFTRGRLILPPVEMRHTFPAWPAVALDTGARLSVITPELARALGFEPEELKPTTGIVGATGPASGAALSVASVSVMGAEVRDLRVVCYALHPRLGLDGVLGMDFLKHFDIEIRNSTETVTLARWRE